MNNLVQYYLPIDSKKLLINCVIPPKHSRIKEGNLKGIKFL